MDPIVYLRKFNEDKDSITVEKLLQEINRVEERKNEILEKFPEQLQISCFKINQADVREKVKQNAKKLRQSLFELIKEKGKK